MKPADVTFKAFGLVPGPWSGVAAGWALRRLRRRRGDPAQGRHVPGRKRVWRRRLAVAAVPAAAFALVRAVVRVSSTGAPREPG
ncbi:hypothetical protein [Kitasatospora sp. NPDC001547]|uniref:hypothetical protein n=1 Tax=Kitasatospora sp. NPDC001547 TaxID=3364015 RepID=UPI0036846660